MVARHLLSVQEIIKHSEAGDCCIVVGNKLRSCIHLVILQCAGHDATHLFHQVHSDDLSESRLPLPKHMGDPDRNSIDDQQARGSPYLCLAYPALITSR
ncbi:unnamed protein product [Penicillium camemberti]|uniref:Str. FM013 n=1 Tax=Penicillium camemberti (strain FM 013) TaxID=1429867 RepID=A0A0G4P1S0_PENC3|nr:unnamed protein product [Penicillium camemberti]